MSQGWSKIFNRINWLNRPSTNTPLNATNLNAGDSAIDKLDDRIITLDTVKADMQVVNGMVADVSLNSNTGVITVTYKNGSHVDYDTNLEKIAVNFSYDYVNQRLVLTLPDGTTQYVDMSALITQYEFKDSSTIAFSVDSTGKVSASVKNGSITEAMLETGYLANIKVEVAKAEAAATQAQSSEASSDYNAKLSRSYAIGGSGIREGEDTDNAMYYYEQAKKTDIGQIRSEVDELNSNLDVLQYGDESGNSNLLNLNKCSFNKNNISISLEDNEITVNGSYYSSLLFYKLLDVGIYSISFEVKSQTDYAAIRVLYDDNSYSDEFSRTFSINSQKKIKGLMIYSSGSSNVGTSVYKNVQIEEGTTATQYEPYIPSVKMLADEVNQQNESLADLGKCKNLLNPTLQTTTINGVTCTNNGDGTFTFNGTATANLTLDILTWSFITPGIYRVVGCPSGGSMDKYTIETNTPPTTGANNFKYDIGNGVDLTVSPVASGSNENIVIRIIIKSGCVCNNLVFKPMLTTNTGVTYNDFVPYTGDGDTLTHDVADLKNDLPTFGNNDNITNIDNAKSDKTYSGIAYKGATNYPDTESNFCMVTFFSVFDISFGVQFAHTDKSDIYSRSLQNGVWTAWKKLNN